jgi:hypothetical protein
VSGIPPAAVVLACLAFAAVVVLIVGSRAQGRRDSTGRAMLRSIPDGLARAKKQQRHVLVLFLDPGDASSKAIVELVFDPGFARLLSSFERVRIDAPAGDLDVVNHVAAKYGLPAVEPPTALALDRDGRRIDALVGSQALGVGSPESLREHLAGFLEKVRGRF